MLRKCTAFQNEPCHLTIAAGSCMYQGLEEMCCGRTRGQQHLNFTRPELQLYGEPWLQALQGIKQRLPST